MPLRQESNSQIVTKISSDSYVNSMVAAGQMPPVQGRWIRGLEKLSFSFGGRELATIRVKTLTLDVPFVRLGTYLNDAAPSWRVFPPGVKAAVVPVQPIEASPPRVTYCRPWCDI